MESPTLKSRALLADHPQEITKEENVERVSKAQDSMQRMGVTSIRELWAPPKLHQDWDEEYEERSADWWELFVDLILVAICSNLATMLRLDLTYFGLGMFALQANLTMSLWSDYNSFTTRFKDSTLAHCVILFIFMCGMVTCVAHISSDYHKSLSGFCMGLFLQNMSLFLMHMVVYIFIPRARVMMKVQCGRFFVNMVISAAAVWTSFYVTIGLLVFMAVFDVLKLNIMRNVLTHDDLIPLNIDHASDRHSAFIIVILGESVVSAGLEYNSLEEEDGSLGAYYFGTIASFALSFAFALLYFHVTPTRAQHAFRTSAERGLTLIRTYALLGPVLLAVGVAIKVSMDNVLNQTHMTDREVFLFGGSLSISLACLLMIRHLHFGAHDDDQDDHEPECIVKLKQAWWIMVIVSVPVPILMCIGLRFLGPVDPLNVLYCQSGFLALITLIETWIAHTLRNMWDNELMLKCNMCKTELSQLLQDVQKEYGAMAKEHVQNQNTVQSRH